MVEELNVGGRFRVESNCTDDAFVKSESVTVKPVVVREWIADESELCAESKGGKTKVKSVTTAKTRIGNTLKLRFICKDSAFCLLLTSRALKYTEIV